jgi:hypothetical protein
VSPPSGVLGPWFKRSLCIFCKTFTLITLILYQRVDSYDVVVANGAFAPGHLYPDCLPELLRVVKPGTCSPRKRVDIEEHRKEEEYRTEFRESISGIFVIVSFIF